MRTAMFRVGLASTLGFLARMSWAHTEQDAEMDGRSALPEPSWKGLGRFPLAGLPSLVEGDGIARTFLQASSTLAVTDMASTEHGKPNTGYQVHRR